MAAASPPTRRWAGTGRSTKDGAPQLPGLSSGPVSRYAQVLSNDCRRRRQMIELFGSALVTFLVIIDPPGCAPIFASLTRGTPPAHRRAMAIRSSLIAWAILMFFALLGEADASRARHQPGELPHRRRHHAVLHRARHGVRAAHRAARGARRVDRGHARGRGHQRLPDGDADDRRPRLDRQRDAVGVARGNACSRRGRPRRDHGRHPDHHG